MSGGRRWDTCGTLVGPVRPLQLQMHLHLHPTAGAQGHRNREGDREGEDHANRTRQEKEKEKEKEKDSQGDLSPVVLHSFSSYYSIFYLYLHTYYLGT